MPVHLGYTCVRQSAKCCDHIAHFASVLQLIERNAPGYAIGGLAGGETKDMFWRVVAQCAAGLPPGKPRYVMGIGYPLDVVVCSALGADMYDSVYPTRTARFGVALVDSGKTCGSASVLTTRMQRRHTVYDTCAECP